LLKQLLPGRVLWPSAWWARSRRTFVACCTDSWLLLTRDSPSLSVRLPCHLGTAASRRGACVEIYDVERPRLDVESAEPCECFSALIKRNVWQPVLAR
jgi:hypothetical protein